MEISSLKHSSDSIYSFPVSKDEIEIRFLTKKDDGILKVELLYNDKYSFHKSVKATEIKKSYSDDRFDYYVLKMRLYDKRFAYIFRLTLINKKICYFSETGVSDTYDIEKGFYNFFQVPFINESDVIHKNPILQNRVFYQIFVDRFYKVDNENPRINIRWGDQVSQKSIAGGNLKGIRKKLPYLKELGIDALYLTPIFDSDSNHKYDTRDYYRVSADFGDLSDLKSLVEEVHQSGMILLLDGVFNHVSIEFPFFKDVLEKGEKSEYFDWFFIRGKRVNLNKANYETFADCADLPRLNLNNPEVQKYIIEIGKHYLKDYQIDGYRLDVSDEIPHSFWVKFRTAMKEVKEDVILLGENWHNAASYLNSGQEFDSIMNYAFTKETLEYVAKRKINAETYKNRLISNLNRYKSNVNYNLLNLLSSHDVDRFLTECGDVDRYLIGYSILFMYIGVPCVYYGEEIGIKGGYDPYNRACFDWDESRWDTKIHKTISKLIKIHKEYSVNEMDISISSSRDLFYLTRYTDKKELKLIVNLSGKAQKIRKKGRVLLSNLYSDQMLEDKGFMILKEEKE